MNKKISILTSGGVAKKLAVIAKEKEDVRRELAVTAESLRLKAIELAAIAKEKEEVRRELAIRIHDLENASKANRNILEDLQVEREVLTRARDKDEAILASIGEALVAVDKSGVIVEFNEQFIKLLGVPATENVKGKRYSDIWQMQTESGKTLPLEKRPIEVALSGKSVSTRMYYYIRADKTRFPVSITASPIFAGKEVTGVVAVFQDITREKAIDKAKSEFVSVASHQLRTPLGIMKWYLEALLTEGYVKKAPAAIQDYFDVIYRSNERELSLVRDLLSVSRIEEGRVKDLPKATDLAREINEVVKQMAAIASKKGICFRLDFEDKNIPMVKIDALRFREVIENLISNAIEYSVAKDTILISVKKIGDTLSVSVKDSGMGISEGDQKNIFTKFFRSEEAVKGNPEGSGLGLYVVKSYVEGWGGKITVESVYGEGSTFTMSLPLRNSEKRKEV